MMKACFSKASLLLALLLPSAAFAADLGVSVQFGQPGFYGSLNIGEFQQPRLIYREPRIIQRVTVAHPPMYLIVPPGHAKNWSRHCGRYNACSRPVYFVQESWYNNKVVPRYRHDRHEERHEDHRNDDRDHRGNIGNGRHHDGEGHGRGHNRH